MKRQNSNNGLLSSGDHFHQQEKGLLIMNKLSNTYKEWSAEVDRILVKKVGLDQGCMADWLSRDAYDDGLSAEEGALICLEAQDFFSDQDLTELFN